MLSINTVGHCKCNACSHLPDEQAVLAPPLLQEAIQRAHERRTRSLQLEKLGRKMVEGEGSQTLDLTSLIVADRMQKSCSWQSGLGGWVLGLAQVTHLTASVSVSLSRPRQRRKGSWATKRLEQYY